jgi:hypothetical protein
VRAVRKCSLRRRWRSISAIALAHCICKQTRCVVRLQTHQLSQRWRTGRREASPRRHALPERGAFAAGQGHRQSSHWRPLQQQKRQSQVKTGFNPLFFLGCAYFRHKCLQQRMDSTLLHAHSPATPASSSTPITLFMILCDRTKILFGLHRRSRSSSCHLGSIRCPQNDRSCDEAASSLTCSATYTTMRMWATSTTSVEVECNMMCAVFTLSGRTPPTLILSTLHNDHIYEKEEKRPDEYMRLKATYVR